MSAKLLELKNIKKFFGPTKALNGVSFDLNRSEIHCLVGENGAGKSTLIKTLAGLHRPDGGEIWMDGKQVQIDSPNASEALGISVVHQELNLCEHLTVAENIFLGNEPQKGLFLDKRAQNEKARELLGELGLNLVPSAIVQTLSTGERQITEIVRAVSGGINVIIFDEPTSSLSDAEANKLFTIVEGLRDKGLGVIYISHRLDEIFRLADRVTVLRDGESVGTLVGDEIEQDRIVSMMVGRNLTNYYVRNNKPSQEILFEAKNVSGGILRDVSFNVRKGEIVGFAGLIGAGRTELMRLVFGIDKRSSGQFLVEGKEVKMNTPAAAIRSGVTYIPEDRKLEGLFLEKSIAFNTSICSLRDIIKNFHVNRRAEGELVEKYGSRMKLKMASANQEVRALSGGNQQKVLIGRWLAVSDKVIILDEPTRGIDVGSKADIYKILDELTGQGYGVVMVSSELQEIVGMCDRVYVMRDSRIAGCLEKDEINQVSVMNYAMGVNE